VIFATLVSAGGAFAAHTGDTGGGAQIELWQVINLIGAPLLAILFARPVIDDIRAWRASRREGFD